MEHPGIPDVVVVTDTPLLCPECWRMMGYAPNTARYVCEYHGPQLTAEQLATLCSERVSA